MRSFILILAALQLRVASIDADETFAQMNSDSSTQVMLDSNEYDRVLQVALNKPELTERAFRVMFDRHSSPREVLQYFRAPVLETHEGEELLSVWRETTSVQDISVFISDENEVMTPFCSRGQCKILSPGFKADVELVSARHQTTLASFEIRFECDENQFLLPEDLYNEFFQPYTHDFERFTRQAFDLIERRALKCIPKVSIWDYHIRINARNKGLGTKIMDSIVDMTQQLFANQPEAGVRVVAGTLEGMEGYTLSSEDTVGALFWAVYGFEFRPVGFLEDHLFDQRGRSPAERSVRNDEDDGNVDDVVTDLDLSHVNYPWQMAYNDAHHWALKYGVVQWHGELLVNQPNSPGMRWRNCRSALKQSCSRTEYRQKIREFALQFDHVPLLRRPLMLRMLVLAGGFLFVASVLSTRASSNS